MAVTIITPTFGPVIFSKNPVIYRFRSLNESNLPYGAQGAVATIQAGSGSKFATGGTMTVTMEEPDGTSEAVVFTAAGTYTAEDAIPDSSYGGSISEYWEIVRGKVAGHHRIAPYLTVTRSGPIGGNKLTLKSIDPDSAWAITIANTEGFTVAANSPVPDNTPDNYAVLLEVFVEMGYGSGQFRLSAQLENTPDADGYLYFDIGGILAAECKASLNEPVVPSWATQDIATADNLRRFYIRYTEAFGSPVVAQEWQYDPVRNCMNGGVAQSIFAGGDYLATLDATNSILSWQPDGKRIAMDQPEWLAWYNYDSEARTIRLEMQWYSIVDNALSTATRHFTALEVASKGVAILPVKPALLGLDSEDDAYRFKVRVVYDDGGTWTELSPWRNYYIDRDLYPNSRFLQYLNGFGTPESIRCTGNWSKRLEVSRTIAVRPLLPDFNELASDTFQFAQSFEQELTYRTGFLRRSEAETLQEMLISGEVYDVSSDGYIPLRITARQFNVTETNEDLHAYAITAVPRLEMRNFSKKIIDPASGAWQEPDGNFWFDAFLVPWELP